MGTDGGADRLRAPASLPPLTPHKEPRVSLRQKLFIDDAIRIMKVLPPALRIRIYVLFFLMFILAVFEVLSVLSMSFMAMSVAAPQMIMKEPAVGWILETFPSLKTLCSDLRYFTLTASIGVVILTVIKNVLSALVGWKGACIGEDVAIFSGSRIMNHYLNSDYMWHISSSSTDMFQALGWRQQLSLLLVNLLNVYTYALTTVALFFALVAATPGIILACLAVTGLLSYMVYRTMKDAIDRSGMRVTASSAQESRTTLNAMNGIREVLIYRQQPVFFRKYVEACRAGLRARSFLTIAPPIPSWILEIFGFSVIPATIWLLIDTENASMPVIASVVTMVMLAAWRILPILNRSLGCLVMVRSVRPMALKCLERLEAIREQNLPPRPEPDPDFRFERSIALENVSFRYPGADRLSLAGITFTIRKGTQVGLVGPSGAGKSTLVGILSGLMSPESGRFLVDGKAVTGGRLTAYCSRVGYVPQTPYIMSGTIAENVAFSQWGKPYDEEKVRRACRMAALDVVEKDPRGIDYPLGEHGAGLSGGQAQRVSIARALYADPEILILDESTSALDQGTEAAIMETIRRLKGMTVIIIAHRLTTVEHCDDIVWIQEGKVIKTGSPADVLEEYRRTL